MPQTKLKKVTDFHGGITSNDKSDNAAEAASVEELDILSNANSIQAQQIFSSDSLPSNSELYAYASRDDGNDTLYGYGKDTSDNDIRLFSLSNADADNPGSWSTLDTLSNIDATKVSPLMFHKTDESNTDYLYYVDNSGNLRRYDLSANSDSSVGSLSGFSGNSRIAFNRIFGELYICHGQFIAKVDDSGTFTEKDFTLPNGRESVDITAVGAKAVILTRPSTLGRNNTIGYWWDLTASEQFDDSFFIPMGGAQWIENFKEQILVCCAKDGQARFYQMSGAFEGAIPLELQSKRLDNIASETSTQYITARKMMTKKDGILYFGINKTDKTGVYAFGKLDQEKQLALYLAKRFDTTDYSNHSPTALNVLGPNFYAAYDDDGTASTARVETNNSPDRSSKAIYETVWYDIDEAVKDKHIEQFIIVSKPLPANTSLSVKIATDYGSLSSITQPDGTDFNDQDGTIGYYEPGEAEVNVVKFEIGWTSNGTDSPKLTELDILATVKDFPSRK